MTQTIRWGIIGVGDVTEKKSGPGFQQAQHSQLVAVMRRNAAKAEDYAHRHGVPFWTTDARKLIHHPEVDAVYIATPPDSHCSYTEHVAAAGKPVYVEKPMARTYVECQTMINACEAAGVPLFVAYYRRAMPRFERVRQLIAEGHLGNVRSVHITLQRPASAQDTSSPKPWRVLPDIAGGGYFVDMGSHTLDLLDWLFGPIQEVHGIAHNHAGNYPAEDAVSAAFSFENGILGSGRWCFNAFKQHDEVVITGDTGELRFSCFDETPLRLETPDGHTHINAPYPEVVQQPLIQQIVDTLNGVGSCSSTGQTAARTNQVIDSILATYRSL
ncbi:MAG: Gfo/Idh/MocA family oxidoreductase [Deinococcota bacterium]